MWTKKFKLPQTMDLSGSWMDIIFSFKKLMIDIYLFIFGIQLNLFHNYNSNTSVFLIHSKPFFN